MAIATYLILEKGELGGPALLFLQLQSHDLRLFIFNPTKKGALKAGRQLLLVNLWFDFSRIPSQYIRERKRKELEFNRFNVADLYRYKRLGSIPRQELIGLFEGFVESIRTNEKTIRKIMTKSYRK
jgi:hypothetical protein